MPATDEKKIERGKYTWWRRISLYSMLTDLPPLFVCLVFWSFVAFTHTSHLHRLRHFFDSLVLGSYVCARKADCGGGNCPNV